MYSILYLQAEAQDGSYLVSLRLQNRPTSSGLQSPVGAPVQFGPSPLTREYSATPPGHIPPAQWGEFYGRAGDDGCELFGSVPNDDDAEEPCPQPAVHQPDELHDVRSPVAPLQQAPMVAARCVNGTLLRPGNAEEDQPSTACQQSEVCAPGGVPLGRGTPGQQQSPGGLRGRNINPPPPPPPPPPPVPHASAAPSAARYPLQWTPLHTRPKASGGGDPPGDPPNQGSGSASQWSLPGGHPSGQAGPPPPGGGPGGGASQGGTPLQQSGGGAGNPGSTPPTPPGIAQPPRSSDPWSPLDRSRKALPKLSLPSNYKACNAAYWR